MTRPRVLDSEIADIVPPALGKPGSALRSQLLARPNVPGLPTLGIWRVRGAAWSAILKVLHPPTESSAWAGDPDPAHPFFWRREAEAFARLSVYLGADADPSHTSTCSRPSQFSRPGPGIRMPHRYGVVDRPDGSVAIWMEDVHGAPASDWKLERYGLLAYQLAELHSAPRVRALTRRALAGQEGWLGRQWLRTYVGRRDPVGDVLADPEVWRHPAVRRVLDPNRAGAFLRLWESRYDYLAAVEAQPAVLCPRAMPG